MFRVVMIGIAWAICLFADHSAMHAYHTGTLEMECGACHLPSAPASVVLHSPGHEQCSHCHPSAFRIGRKRTAPEELVCSECHGQKRGVPQLTFSHARHIDALARTDPRTGIRADCVFCHKQDASLPGHTECAACHQKAGRPPQLAECRGCHQPEEPSRELAAHYADIRFSHAVHSKQRIGCVTCHSTVASLPTMLDCAQCHERGHQIASQFRLSNCSACHLEQTSGPVPNSHDRNVRPPSHNAGFRMDHSVQASSPDAKCYACHLAVSSAALVSDRCVGCHQVMRPASHTARWKDDVHGKFAALDRTTCATCHTADTCSRCHNQTPRSHLPLALFKNGGHAVLALADERSCLTCHTFANTCASCHRRALR